MVFLLLLLLLVMMLSLILMMLLLVLLVLLLLLYLVMLMFFLLLPVVQDGVPTAIHDLRAAGMRVWMLTGDKPTTALQIAVACSMCPPLQDCHVYDFNGSADGRRGIAVVPVSQSMRCVCGVWH